jgi:glycosyltransferase involved in cell wall biosynthesis
MGKRLSICNIASTYPRSEEDVAVPWLREQTNLLAQKGYDVSVFAPSFHGQGDHTVDGVPVHRFRYFLKSKVDLTHDSGAPSKVGKLSYFAIAILYLIRGTLAFGKHYRKNKFDVVHVHWPFPHANFLRFIKRKDGHPRVILNFHGAELALARRQGFIGKIIRKNLTKHTQEADGVITNSTSTANTIRTLLGVDVPISIIPYGCPIEVTDAPRIEHSLPRILYVGRLIERKGVEYLLRAFKLLREKMDAELVIVGNGFLLRNLQDLASELGLGQSVRFLSDLTSEELGAQYLSSNVFVLPAIIDSKGDTEGLGVVLIEAMTFGLPCVASGVGGIVDVVLDEETGLLVPEKDPEALMKALQRVLSDKELASKLVNNATSHIERSYSWPSVIQRLEVLYSEAGVVEGIRPREEVGRRESLIPK